MKTVLITGTNRGIGLEHVRRFVQRGIQVFAAVRSPTDAAELRELADAPGSTIKILPYDAADPAAPAGLKAALGDTSIDLLFANAGVMGDRKQSFGSVDVEEVLHLVRVNSLAPLKLAEALADNLANSADKLNALQSSQMGSIGDNSSGGYYAYRVSPHFSVGSHRADPLGRQLLPHAYSSRLGVRCQHIGVNSAIE